jgi:hypothetical protein
VVLLFCCFVVLLLFCFTHSDILVGHTSEQDETFSQLFFWFGMVITVGSTVWITLWVKRKLDNKMRGYEFVSSVDSMEQATPSPKSKPGEVSSAVPGTPSTSVAVQAVASSSIGSSVLTVPAISQGSSSLHLQFAPDSPVDGTVLDMSDSTSTSRFSGTLPSTLNISIPTSNINNGTGIATPIVALNFASVLTDPRPHSPAQRPSLNVATSGSSTPNHPIAGMAYRTMATPTDAPTPMALFKAMAAFESTTLPTASSSATLLTTPVPTPGSSHASTIATPAPVALASAFAMAHKDV